MIIIKPHQEKIFSKFDFPNEIALERALQEDKSKELSTIGSAVGTGIGLAASIALARRNQPIKDIFVKGDIDKTAKNFLKYTKIDYEGLKGLKYMLLQASGASLGSFLFASAGDRNKESRLEKLKEVVFILNNVAIPTGLAKLCEHFLSKEHGSGILKTISQNKILKNAAPIVALAAGLAISTSVTNTINTKIIEPDDKRKKKIKPNDMIAHIDDIIPILISSKDSKLQTLPLDRLMPVVYFILGRKVGVRNFYTNE